MYNIKLTSLAEIDLTESYEYIKTVLKNPKAAEQLVIAAENNLIKIVETPYACSLVSDTYLKNLGIRFLPVSNYVFFYKIDEELKEIIVIRFLYGKREWLNLLREKKES